MEALLYERLDDFKVRCHLCAHRCKINDGQSGICRVRTNQRGRLVSLVYGKVIARHVDPIEKKTPVSLHARQPQLLHRYGRLQF